ncbi:indolepyruvate oxidoreductase [Odoribacter laneus]|jgi:indolepyruvate ferredoxin oxidoreductase, beta subunit|uniref:Indolepyruvate ferredoxin oxidoreductase, beta subunit n=1 Tax=Odoribacter laneus YIT 12061 TaxID=742817 RepID=H1DJC5_9BACT|nr:indolepyruvate oxidoreductase subunit beta [Odoribacter laneus]EHP46380.1 indolepyruvate ferredoxin oxidoreductase, beta subunit [Odoribacter laneus YIT 12061]GKI21574.1 indolepyruvate oxidoreductase [Odoribacter laneus]GKI26156.1 indolepyruvate oxidoreductase [Odoribacter laneus]
MKTNIILAGVGGQGILSIAAALGSAALNNNLYMKQAETHGMSQRGGDVQSFMRISDRPIYSDLIAKGKADIILSVEPMEALRYLPYLKEGGYVVTNSTPLINIPNYPDIEIVLQTLRDLPHRIIIDADQIAKETTGQTRASNFVMLGAASPFIEIPFDYLEEGIRSIFSRKGETIVDMNLKALHAGRKFAQENL